MKNTKITLGVIGCLIVLFGFYLFGRNDVGLENRTRGSVGQGGECHATTTSTGRFVATTSLLQTGNGTLCSVIVTGAASGVIHFYDATTTAVNLRSADQATSSILIANLPASIVAGTYVFDFTFNRGLLVDIIGTMPTTTITYR